MRRRVSALHRYNSSFLELFGVKRGHPGWFRWLCSWLLGSGVATFLLTLLVNLVDAFSQLLGLTGIPMDQAVIPLMLVVIPLSFLLLAAAIPPSLSSPPNSLTALGILTALHLFGFHHFPGLPYAVADALCLGSTFLYFAFVAFGVVGTILSTYLLLRYYAASWLIHRFRRRSQAGGDE